MRKKVGRREGMRTVAPVSAYLDEVEELCSVLSDDGARDVELDTSDYEVDGINDLKNMPRGSITDLSLNSTAKPLVFVRFTSVGAVVVRFDETTEAVGIAERARQVLVRSRRKPAWAYSYYFIIAASVPNWFASFGDRFVDLPSALDRAVTYVGLASLPLVLYLLFVRIWRGSVVHLRYRNEASTFWSRNRDALVVGLIVAAVSTTATFVLTLVFAR